MKVATLIMIMTACSLPAMAQQVVKSVDEAGNVTYSSSAPSNAVSSETVTIDAPPPASATAESQAKAEEAVDTAKQLIAEDEAKKASAAAEDAAAREAVSNAERNLAEAKVIQDTDWQNLQTGGRVLKQSYYERVETAEAALENARKGAGQ